MCNVFPLKVFIYIIIYNPANLATFCVCCQVPCVAVVENMCHFDADGKRFYPFGRGSGAQVRKTLTK